MLNTFQLARKSLCEEILFASLINVMNIEKILVGVFVQLRKAAAPLALTVTLPLKIKKKLTVNCKL